MQQIHSIYRLALNIPFVRFSDSPELKPANPVSIGSQQNKRFIDLESLGVALGLFFSVLFLCAAFTLSDPEFEGFSIVSRLCRRFWWPTSLFELCTFPIV